MSKKHTKRMNSRDVNTNQVIETTKTAVKAAEMRSPLSTRSMTGSEFNPDYGYVKKDLTRIGTLAVAFFIVLVVLSFIL